MGGTGSRGGGREREEGIGGGRGKGGGWKGEGGSDQPSASFAAGVASSTQVRGLPRAGSSSIGRSSSIGSSSSIGRSSSMGSSSSPSLALYINKAPLCENGRGLRTHQSCDLYIQEYRFRVYIVPGSQGRGGLIFEPPRERRFKDQTSEGALLRPFFGPGK